MNSLSLDWATGFWEKTKRGKSMTKASTPTTDKEQTWLEKLINGAIRLCDVKNSHKLDTVGILKCFAREISDAVSTESTVRVIKQKQSYFQNQNQIFKNI